MPAKSLLLVLSLLAAPALLPAQEYGPQPDAATRAELLAVREAAWRAWFANDKAGFERIVPAELVALSWNGGAWEDREQTEGQMAEFAKGGMRIATLEFPRTIFQRYGDVVIVYSSFHLVLADSAGTEQETNGRGTEIFVRRKGKWIHTGWHLDQIAE